MVKFGRPHYHIILFGIKRDDNRINDAWGLGAVHLGSVTYQSCRYVADYIGKVYSDEKHKVLYGDREKPFALMSKGDWQAVLYG